jgi:hypothetical protein
VLFAGGAGEVAGGGEGRGPPWVARGEGGPRGGLGLRRKNGGGKREGKRKKEKREKKRKKRKRKIEKKGKSGKRNRKGI